MRIIFKVIKGSILRSFLVTISLCVLVSCKSQKQSSSTSNKSTHSKNSEKPVDTEKLVKTARSYLGTKYKYGGTGRSGMDCSGLITISYSAINIQLPHSSTEQMKLGKPVKIQEIREGDLVFFSDKKGNEKVSHVGMVTEVKNSSLIVFIHATTKAGVIEDNLFSNYWHPLLVKAIRVF